MDSLLAGVVAAPDQDSPRLAYAAAIAAQDPDRSRFIELQVQIAAVERAARGQSSPQARYAAEDLLKVHGGAWASRLCPPCTEVHYDRGFVEHVRLSMHDFLVHGATLFQLAPIRHLDLSFSPGAAEQLFASPLLSTVRSLNLDCCQLGDQEMRWLAASPYLRELEWLELLRNNIGMPGARALAASTMLPQLRYVGFFGNAVDPTEELFFDQGCVVGGALPEQGQALEAEFGRIPWLHLDAATSWDVPPQRY